MATSCPAWCKDDNDCTVMHERVVGRFGQWPGPRAHVTIDQSPDTGSVPTVALWTLGDEPTGYQPTEALHLTPADAALLARVMCGVPEGDIIRFAAALAEAARILGHGAGGVAP